MFQSTTTFAHSTDAPFAEQLTLFPADSLASRSASRVSKKEKTMSDISFHKCFELYQKSARVGSSQKMFAAYLTTAMDAYSRKFVHTWRAKITASKRLLFLLVPSMPRTDATEYGSLLLTPRSREIEQNVEQFVARMAKYQNGTTMPNLATQISALLPTPTSGRADQEMSPSQYDRHTFNLAQTIQLLSTPKAAKAGPDYAKLDRSATGVSLETAIGMLLTPATRDRKGTNSPEHLAKERGHHDQLPNALQMKAGLKLQPAFVEWMMSFPIGWTDLNHSETPSCL